ncbi:hypothetical protein HDU83_007382 [Entophlyctis luteolus]|nr:hypothetical protein HDU83_007382 [Entophlyctis luteolus]
MPASTAYLIYLIYASIQANQAPIISLIMMASAYGMQAVIFLFKGQYQHIDAYWHFDDFKWGNTRKGAAADTGGGHGSGTDDEELIPLDPSTVPLMTWEAFEKIMIDKGHPGFKSPMSSTNTIAESVQVKVSSPSQPQHHIGSLQGSLNYAPSIAPLDAAKLPVVGLSQSQQFSKENSRQQSRSAELEPAPAAKVPVAQDGFTNQNLEAVPNTAPSKNLAEWTGGFPPDEAIVKFVEHIIENSDLSQLSKKKVREAANAYFKQDLSGKKAFINEVVERIIQG